MAHGNVRREASIVGGEASLMSLDFLVVGASISQAVGAHRKRRHGEAARSFRRNALETASAAVQIPEMKFGLSHFGAASIDWPALGVGEDGRIRHALAHGPWERENWRSAQGVPCLAQASKALLQLVDMRSLSLPGVRPSPEGA